MNEKAQEKKIDFSVDKNSLYREENITDLKVGSIRRLLPIKLDGTEDESRTAIFIGDSQLMSPEGPVPLQTPLEANSLEEAIEAFPAAMDKSLAEMIEKIKKMQEERQMQQKDDSRIVVPGA
ncbi:MAG: cytoplasmic protein [Deltaproteobacteria bacterium]|nr:cytoplasmic protein [Deltaproteobacteria bacterium]